MSDYTPSLTDEQREAVLDWMELPTMPPVYEAVARMLAQVRAEEREKAAQIAEEFDPVEAALAGRYAGKDIAARIREQGKEQGS